MSDQQDRDQRLRCFVGAFLESESAERLAPALRLPARARRVDRSTWHVTLRFLGSIPTISVPEVLDAVGALGGHLLAATVTGFVGLPRAAYARVIAADVVDDGCLAAWAEQLAQRFGPEDRPFRPHVTVARSRQPIRFPQVELAEPVSIRLLAPALYCSHLDPAGAWYQRLGEAEADQPERTTGSGRARTVSTSTDG